MTWRKTAGQFILPILLAALNAVMLVALISFLQPMIDDLDLQYNRQQSQARQLQAKVRSTQRELDLLADSKATFERLLGDGFLDRQNRLAAAKTLERLRGAYGLAGLQYEIRPEARRGDLVPAGQDLSVISTEVSITMRGLLDTDLVAFARAVTDELPGQVRLKSLALQRARTPDEDGLQALRDGQWVSFVQGKAVFEWRTLRFPTAEEETS